MNRGYVRAGVADLRYYAPRFAAGVAAWFLIPIVVVAAVLGVAYWRASAASSGDTRSLGDMPTSEHTVAVVSALNCTARGADQCTGYAFAADYLTRMASPGDLTATTPTGTTTTPVTFHTDWASVSRTILGDTGVTGAANMKSVSVTVGGPTEKGVYTITGTGGTLYRVTVTFTRDSNTAIRWTAVSIVAAS